jgi:hypothetical protein
MSYLMIRNPGVANPAAFTLLGVSTTRHSGYQGTIGMFGSGSKNGVACLLRNGEEIVICPDMLKMNFFSKEINVDGQYFNRVCVKYGGFDFEGTQKSATEDLGFCLEWGTADWTNIAMAFREFVANAIDGATLAGGSYKDVVFEEVDKPRAKRGYTSIFLKLTDTMRECWKQLGTLFLHFSHPHLLGTKILPKLTLENKVLIYKKGVLAKCLENEESVFDYNLGDELTLDESRNAQSYVVRAVCAMALSTAEPRDMAKIIKSQLDGRTVFEGRFETYYVNEWNNNQETKKKCATKFKAAFNSVAGDNAVLVSGKKAVSDFVKRKGFEPVKLEGNWFKTLQQFGVPTEDEVLDGLEKEGFTESDPSPDMLKALDLVWNLYERLDKLQGRAKPTVKGFNPIMSGEAQTGGRYVNGTVYIHTDHSNMGYTLLKIMLEEVAHHCTGAGDMSRDLQDYLFRIITELAFNEQTQTGTIENAG